MIDKRFNLLINVLPDVYICSVRKKSAPLLPEGTDVHIWQHSKFSGSIANSQTMLSEIKKSGVIAKIRI